MFFYSFRHKIKKINLDECKRAKNLFGSIFKVSSGQGGRKSGRMRGCSGLVELGLGDSAFWLKWRTKALEV